MKKLSGISVTVALIRLFTTSAAGQGSFQNLDFESAVVPSVPSDQPTSVPLANAFPGWTGYLGTDQVSSAVYNGISVGAYALAMVDTHTSFYSNNVIAGTFTAVLQAGNANPPSLYGPAAISQTGIVPAGTHSLRFLGNGSAGNLALSLNGQVVPFVALSSGPNYVEYGADVSGYAGLQEELRFTEQPISNPFATLFLDNIQFSPASIPEPSILGMFAMGAVVFGWGLKKNLKI